MRVAMVFAGLGLMVVANPAVIAQPAGRVPADRLVAPPAPPKLPPVGPSPLDYFRQILKMPAAEREKVLAAKSPSQRSFLEARLREFDALSPDDREARIKGLQLRWYLLPLMKMPASNRVERLTAVPESERKLVEERLGLWDQLPADLQKEVLENEAAIRVLFYPSEKTVGNTNLQTLSPQQQELMAKVARWQALPEEKRDTLYAHFQKFFDLDANQKAKTLDALSEAERKQMGLTLQVFESLPKEQRDRCINGFKKFADLSLEERQQFLKNAERWQQMTAKDREVWRRLIARVVPKPPLPPGVKTHQGPPLPPRVSSSLFTNN